MRSVISDILEEGGIEVVAQAKNGRDAVEAVRTHEPDVVTMDVEMPEMNGIEAVERIMADRPTPILMLSAHTDEGADVTFQALENGAVDFFTKPGGEVSMEMSRLKDQLVDIVLSVSKVDPTAGRTGNGQTAARSGTATTTTAGTAAESYVENPTLLIGSSTGGPTVVEQILSELPADANLRILIVQHMPEGFTSRFATRIDARSEYDISEAGHGDRIGPGEGLVAPGGKHMTVSNYRAGRLRVKLTEDPPVNSVRPSVDVTMESAAEAIADPLVGVILTGMGNDGAAGIRALKAAGARTLAQDESTSAVFGMPQRAIETGAIDTVRPLDELSEAIVDAIKTEVH
jgi:two-component system chemotaxis response regulator CheB